ncbi:MAG: Zim17-type zinc finger [Trebouxia sp. A1-2]|nr:MAG: Zim17-type zinc finger [Trebouxia sp. A1-2]KAA6426670.1 MAG: Zim17-type zinc finger [Trebouxia sp. A1-2]
MHRLGQAASNNCRPLTAKQSYMVCQSWLPVAAQAQTSLSEACYSTCQQTSPAANLRGFSSQGLADTPPADASEAQDSRQPLARIQAKDMMAMYTCNICKTRSAKMFSKKTYETGVVIVTCPGCKGNHLIADRLGWFGEPGSIEDYLNQQGQEAQKRTMDGTTQLTAEDLMGWSKARELANQQGSFPSTN